MRDAQARIDPVRKGDGHEEAAAGLDDEADDAAPDVEQPRLDRRPFTAVSKKA